MSDEARVPTEVLERVAATVRELIETPELARFTIARGAEPSARAAELGADAVVDVFRTEDHDEALEVERWLQVQFAAHGEARVDPLEVNPADEGAGLTHVFVALWAVADIPPA